MRPTSFRPSRGLLAAGTALTMLAAAPGVGTAASLLAPADGVYEATITRTAYGIPHIVAEDFGSLGFGQGYGAAEDIVCSIAEVVVTGRAERSKWFGPDEFYTDHVTLNANNLEIDTLFGDINNRRVVEELVASDDPGIAPSAEMVAIVEGYIAGYNRYLADVGGSAGITDPACKGAPWVGPATSMDLFRGIFAANLLASAGVFVAEIANAAPPQEKGDLGLPVSPLRNPLDATAADATDATATDEPRFSPVPEVLPSSDELRAGLGKDPESPFGSNGTALGGDVTDTGRGMVLGNPHFPWQGRYRFTQSQLTIPGVYDVAGAMLHGSPVVNIGFNEDVAWTHTVSTAYRFTPYEYRLVPGTPTTYVTEDDLTADLERREVEVEQPDGTFVTTDVYATPEGYVLDAPSLLMGWTPLSVWALREANAEHLKTLDAFHEMGKASTVAELADAQIRTMGIPWVNTMAADRDGDALYADNSVTPNVTNAQIELCMTPIGRALFELAGLPGLDGTRAGGECAWGTDEDAPRAGILGEANMPDVTTRSWVINANDSYWLPNPELPLTGFPSIMGCEECERSLRTRMVYRYILDRLDGSDGMGGPDEFTFEQLKALEVENRVYGAELARENDDLQTVCAAADVDAAWCDALAAWDGRTNIDSVGAHIFREFFTEPDAQTWSVPFDAADPVNTPRDLDASAADVVRAMEQGVGDLVDFGASPTATLGSLQKAGDEGAGDIAIHGGFGSTGNANVIAIRNPTANDDALYRVSYGSSHIQAVSFTDAGVDASTILTYSQSTNAASDHQDDQTRLWSDEKWVDWAFTPEQIAAGAVSTTTVRGAVATGTDTDVDGALAATGSNPALLLLGLSMIAAATLLRRRPTA